MSSEDFAFILTVGLGALLLNALVCACLSIRHPESIPRGLPEPDECSECGMCDFSEAE